MESDPSNSRSPGDEAAPPPQDSSLSSGNDVEANEKREEYGDVEEASAKIDTLINAFSSIHNEESDVPEIPHSLETFTNMLELHIQKYNLQDSPFKFGQDPEQDVLLIKGVSQLSKLNNLLDEFGGEEKVKAALNLTTPVVQRGMAFMEEELRVSLQEACYEDEDTDYPRIRQDRVESIRKMVGAMISGGYHKVCSQAYTCVRKDAFLEAMKHQDLEKMSNEDIQKMQWETLEGHMNDWVKMVKHASKVVLPGENSLCESVFFPDHSSMGETILTSLAKPMLPSMLSLADAFSMTKPSAERLFKVLDIYEAITHLVLAFQSSHCSRDCITQLRSDISVIRRRMRDTVVGVFSDFQNSIMNDAAKNPVPGGGVHPLTRYITNYLRYASDFRDILDHIFFLHHNNHEDEIDKDTPPQVTEPKRYDSFAAEIIKIMNLLDDNLEAKSRLYKDPSLGYIFLMNNGRYILQKMKESIEMQEVVGDELRRKRSSELRGYHRSYQRETWSRVLQCLNQEGLQVTGKAQKSLVKERLKSFNQMFDDIYKTQSSWVMSDKQLQSELRVSISAVMIPAYRSFVARFGQCFRSGKQAQKYIKYQPEDIESFIEALFDGNAQTLSMPKKKLSFPH